MYEPISVTLLDMLGSDARVVNAARVSMNKQIDEDTLSTNDKSLIKYLAKHGHESPFTHVQITCRITAPVFVNRQWIKSSIGVSRNEVSRRYVSDDPTMFRPPEFHLRPSGSIKQGSGEVINLPDIERMYDEAMSASLYAYKTLLALGLAPEEARIVLPLAHNTTWIETGSLLYFTRVCGLRTAHDAQKSGTQELGNKVLDMLSDIKDIEHSLHELMKYSPRRALARMIEFGEQQ